MYIYKTVCIKQVYIYTLLVICESENKPFQSSVCCQILENLPEYLEGEGGGVGGEKCSTYVLTKQKHTFSPEFLKKNALYWQAKRA